MHGPACFCLPLYLLPVSSVLPTPLCANDNDLAHNGPTEHGITGVKNPVHGYVAALGWWYSLKQTRILWHQVHE
jgi:hypothetical protein